VPKFWYHYCLYSYSMTKCHSEMVEIGNWNNTSGHQQGREGSQKTPQNMVIVRGEMFVAPH
jgi:hypothetical protein